MLYRLFWFYLLVKKIKFSFHGIKIVSSFFMARSGEPFLFLDRITKEENLCYYV